MTRLLGVDLGERRIGLAVGEVGIPARKLAVLTRNTPERDAAALLALAAEQGATELVVGLPRNMDGSEGAQALATRSWAEAIGALTGLPVTLRDERLTSVTAEANLGRVRRGRSGGPPSRAALARRRGAVDREAARLILQAELDARATAR
ncbi:MAG: Holliday junction resolvase RuvX [Candidatus Limnocylindrales bacterium]